MAYIQTTLGNTYNDFMLFEKLEIRVENAYFILKNCDSKMKRYIFVYIICEMSGWSWQPHLPRLSRKNLKSTYIAVI